LCSTCSTCRRWPNPGADQRESTLEGNSMSNARRSGPSPALVLLVSTAATVIVFLLILALRGGDIVDQLRHVWASFFPPDPTTSQGRIIDDLYTFVFIIAAAIFLVVEGLIVYAVVRYRRRPDETDLPPQIHGNNILEVVWTVVPTIIVAAMFVLSWQALNTVDAATADPQDTRIRVVASRFQWTFDYLAPDGQTVQFTQIAPEMVVPAGENVHLTLEAKDVIHAFYVPQFLFKRDVVPGRVNSFEFFVEPAFAGQTFRGQCAELCGAQHWAMQFSVRALAPAEFDAWLQQQIDQANASPSPVPSGGLVLELRAFEIKFDKSELTVPADTPFVIHFQNDDAGVPHDVAIREGSPTGNQIFHGETFTGVGARDYAVQPLPAGTYGFACTIHPNMTGTLTAE
jgi:cytochrome c oxidase subunit 2